VLHDRGDVRDTVSVFSGDDVARIRLLGDDTGATSGSVPDLERVIAKINYGRILRTTSDD